MAETEACSGAGTSARVPLASAPGAMARDIRLPLFILQIPQKTLAQYELRPADWLELLGALAGIDLNEANITSSFVSLEAFREIMMYGRTLFGPEKFLRLYLEDITPAHLGPAGMVMATAPTVGEGLSRWIDCGRYVLPILTVNRHYSSELFWTSNVLNADLGESGIPFIELIVLLTVRLVGEISGGLAKPRVRFAHPRTLPLAFYEQLLGIRPEFDAEETSLILPRDDLDRCNGNHTPIAYLQAQQNLREVARLSPSHASLSQHVRQLLADAGAGGRFFSLDEMAGRLNMSARTLARRLGDEGLHFRELQSQTRIEVAKQLLQQPGAAIKSVYERAGFNDLSAFSRAFRRHARLSPREYQDRYGGRLVRPEDRG